MFNNSKPNEIENWVCVMEAGKEYEIEIAKNYLADNDIPANMLSKRDSSYNLNIGDMALVYLYVPNEYEEQARKLLAESDIHNDEYNNEEE